MRTHLCLLIILFLASCKKETLLESAPSLVGKWKHYSGEGDYHMIEIYENSEGKMQWYLDNDLADFTKVRTWYMKDNTIYFGKIALNGELYEVIDFPANCTSQSVENYDTLKVGKRYMRLDQGLYVEQ